MEYKFKLNLKNDKFMNFLKFFPKFFYNIFILNLLHDDTKYFIIR